MVSCPQDRELLFFSLMEKMWYINTLRAWGLNHAKSGDIYAISWNSVMVRRIPLLCMAANNWLLHEAGPLNTMLIIQSRFDSPKLPSQLHL
ncbi:unnamed protein product [Sphenostylis stenocarpa]|uniref:Uncharacterized protein n=1 Tax=Sphenostylis stenocarpa TaxID=92480 RepID=A0AA86SMF3_9FABA|nr:unnamed protein product [Sphenostylis stenocarpa]